MADFLNPETFEFFARYILAGFVIIAVANSFVFGQKPKPAEALLEIVVYSLVNQLGWALLAELGSWMVLFDGKISTFEFWLTPNPEKQFFYQVILLPVLLGCVLGISTQRRWLQPVFRVLSLPITDPYPRAYDHVFAEFAGEALVAIHYSSGNSVFGKYGLESRASRDPNHSELFLERLYTVDEAGNWKPSEPPRSALASLEGMSAVEILKFEDIEELSNGT